MEQKKRNIRKLLRRLFCAVLAIGLLGLCALLGINLWVTCTVSDRILTEQQAAQLEGVDCILVLGCQVRSDGTPSHMLEDRLRRGVALYEAGAAPKLLMSGDHGTKYYNEVDAMKRYALEAGVPSADVFMDHAGFSTYESMSRAICVFEADKIIIVTQEYHLYRAMYVAKALGIEAYGVAADYRTYSGQLGRDIREVLARVKDFGMAIFKPDPTYLGEAIPISGDGALTHDDASNFG
jgi:vancomycin permeability regulator SanA